MMKQITIEEAAGKTFKQFVGFTTHKAALVFTDDTFCLLTIESGYDPGDEWIVPYAEELHPYEFHDAVEAGILSQEEADAINEEENRKQKLKNEEKQRKQYERLKAKFEK